jgi:hypothetical protein
LPIFTATSGFEDLRFLLEEPSGAAQDFSYWQLLWAELLAFSTFDASRGSAFRRDLLQVLLPDLIASVLHKELVRERDYLRYAYSLRA